jgi:hypothetical protein
MLAGQITGVSPAALAAYGYAGASEDDRRFLADAAAEVLADKNPSHP